MAKLNERPLPGLSSRGEIRSILVVRFKALGDIVLSLPIVYACRRRFPGAQIRYLCAARYAEALSGVKELDGILTLPEHVAGQLALARALRRERVDCVLDLLGSPRSALFTYATGAAMRIGMDTGRRNWCYNFLLPRVVRRDGRRIKCYTLEANYELVRALGLETQDDGRLEIGFPAAEREREWARAYVESIGAAGEIIVGMVPGSVYQAKSWPEERFVELGNLLSREVRARPLILWGPGEEELAGRVARAVEGAILAPETGIARLGALIAMTALLVGPDSGPKHLAVIQGVPTVTLFGPTDPCIWDPMTAQHRVVWLSADCSPCRRASCRPNRCLSDIPARAVLNEIVAALEAAARPSARITKKERP
jgi:ADP-heptose:LPS heptosyltransferase